MDTKFLHTMKNIAKTALIAITLMIVPLKQWAQQPQFGHSQATIEFDITQISVFDERIFFIYNLLNDSRFDVINSERDGVFVISADEAYASLNLAATFADFRAEMAEQFAAMDKYVAAETAVAYKADLPNDVIASLMMDFYVRSRTNNTCATSDPFCTDNGMYQFPAGVNAGSGESGPYYDCLSTTPNPAWYHMRILNPGNIDIYMYSTPSVDIDFCCWGPFTDPTSPCPNGLTSNKVVSCSYAAAHTEHCLIPSSAQTGQYYILVITNYSNQQTNISFSKVAGSGTTDCGILPPVVNNSGPYCAGETIQLTANGQSGSSYSWTGPGGWTSTQQNPIRTNCTTAMSGTYTCTISLGGQTNSATTQVVVNAQPVANAGPDQTIIYGATAQLSGSGGAGSFSYQWAPVNMVVNPNAQNTQTVSLTSDQTYYLTVTNPQGGCVSSDQVTIHISGSNMVVTPGDDVSICQGGSAMIQANAGGGTGNFTYSWSPTTGLSNPTASNPIASPSQTTTYTCTVSDGMSTQSVSVTVTVNDIVITHEYVSVCPNQPYSWHGTTYTTAGVYEYDTTTAQGCEETDYLHLDYYPTYDETSVYAAICQGETYYYYGNDYTETGQYPITLQTIHGCDSIVRLNLTVWPENELTENNVSICPELLPYYFYGEYYYENTDVTVWDTDIHGCDSAVRLILTVNDYYQPPTVTKYVGYYDSPSYDWYIPEAGTTITYTESGMHTEILPTSACEGIFTLDLHFGHIPSTQHIIDTVCDSYDWWVKGVKVGTYTNSGNYPYSIPLCEQEGNLNTQYMYYNPSNPNNPTPCTEDYMLDLAVYHSINHQAHIPITAECDSVPFDWFGNTIYFKEDGVYHFPNEAYPQGHTVHGNCDTIMTVTVTNMKYTPHPIIESSDDQIEFPDHPITATEFSVNRYTYHVEDPVSEISTWFIDQCEWTISKSSWPIVISEDKLSCTVYAMDWVPDTIWLEFKAVNKCSTKVARYGLVPSFYGVEEQESYPASVSVIPNPNDGQMELRFSNMEGKINVKVFNTAGLVVDDFEVHTTQTPDSHYYSMKRLPNGVYFFVFSDGKRTTTSKVVIIH